MTGGNNRLISIRQTACSNRVEGSVGVAAAAFPKLTMVIIASDFDDIKVRMMTRYQSCRGRNNNYPLIDFV
jgi:hypothetical protein